MSTRLSFIVVLGMAQAVSASIMIDIKPSSAPNALGSPSWSGYLSNALNSLENNLGNIGSRLTDPTAYEIAGVSINPGDIMVTSFKSWMGVPSPSAPFANEYGNRFHCGLHAYGDGTSLFRLEDLTFEMHSSDSGDTLVFTGNFIGYNYGATRFGVNWGPDRVKGGGDDIYYNSGNGTTLVDEIVYVGIGNAWWPGGSDPDPSNPVGGPQAAIDNAVAYLGASQPLTVSCRYDILGSSNSEVVSVLPEPTTMLLLTPLALLRRRRNKSA